MTGVPDSAFAGEGQEAANRTPRRAVRTVRRGGHALPDLSPACGCRRGTVSSTPRDPKQSTEPIVTICRYMTT
jgi:hypothetical protein